MNITEETYFLLSGEGDYGTWEIIETNNIFEILDEERCNGDKWAHAYQVITARYNSKWECIDAIDYETGEIKPIYDPKIIEFMKNHDFVQEIPE